MQIVCIQGKLTANPSPLATILKQICNNKAQSDKLEIVNFAQKIYTMRKTHFEPIQTKNVGLIGVHENLERPHLVPLKLIKDSQPQPYITNSNSIAKYNIKEESIYVKSFEGPIKQSSILVMPTTKHVVERPSQHLLMPNKIYHAVLKDNKHKLEHFTQPHQDHIRFIEEKLQLIELGLDKLNLTGQEKEILKTQLTKTIIENNEIINWGDAF